MKILMVRHGETDYNKNHLVQGHTDIPLNATGIQQAKDAGLKLKDYNIAAAYSSPMERAYDTCRYMLDNSENQDIAIEKDIRVIEKNYGKFEGATYEEWHLGQEKGDISSVESDTAIAQRIEDFYKEKYDEHKDDTILVVCHGACTRIFLESKKIRPNDAYIVNTSLNEIEYDGENFTLLKYNA
ncbi:MULTISPECIES: histidine phosphatase family protein [unclassified Gemella]|uniref:histidine phosphatase family protein n=1 Tax=unclassified Gemella TaxID=2624949 RepID=UPI0010733908|nr:MULTISPECIES: histidine phosphatase family protein [unclassified Gemella]MBF0710402.1 histidine phosphatase family protein [Gemella sp. GL1.1]MBF0747040.1 histidine phosphatase family protein [Gemella sp. 19428wG2_WT2a]NYS27746.1 histidine phosphatase family protein [Gemella sp. GL1]TFU58533.1 histidine phosphatase family protein [Gemella sp. WT2a]